MLKAERTNDVPALQALMRSKFLKIRTVSACKCFLLGACSIDEVIDRVGELKDDESLASVVESLVDKRSSDELAKVLSPDNWEDLANCLEQFMAIIKRGGLVPLVSCLRIHDRAVTMGEENGEFKRPFVQGLLDYCRFKLSSNARVKLASAMQFARSCIQTPRPEEHKEALEYLAGQGVDVLPYGYDPALHGQIVVTPPLRALVTDIVEHHQGLHEVLRLGEKGLLELLHMGYSVDFATDRYTLVAAGFAINDIPQ